MLIFLICVSRSCTLCQAFSYECPQDVNPFLQSRVNPLTSGLVKSLEQESLRIHLAWRSSNANSESTKLSIASKVIDHTLQPVMVPMSAFWLYPKHSAWQIHIIIYHDYSIQRLFVISSKWSSGFSAEIHIRLRLREKNRGVPDHSLAEEGFAVDGAHGDALRLSECVDHVEPNIVPGGVELVTRVA